MEVVSVNNWNKTICEAKLDLSKKLLEHALSRNKLRYYMVNTSPYILETMDENRYRVPDTGMVMRTLYEVNQEQPELKLAEQFDAEMIIICSNCKHEGILDCAIRIILYQLTAQKEGRAGFTVDCDRYITCLEKLVQILKKKGLNSPKMSDMLQHYNMVLIREFGKSFM